MCSANLDTTALLVHLNDVSSQKLHFCRSLVNGDSSLNCVTCGGWLAVPPLEAIILPPARPEVHSSERAGFTGHPARIDDLTHDDGRGFNDLCYDTTPAKWTYRAIYRVNDANVGQWSKPASITVGG